MNLQSTQDHHQTAQSSNPPSPGLAPQEPKLPTDLPNLSSASTLAEGPDNPPIPPPPLVEAAPAPRSQLLNQPPLAPGSSPSSLSSLPFLLVGSEDLERDFDFLPRVEGREEVPVVNSGSWANEMRLGVDCPEESLLDPAPLRASGTINRLPLILGLGVCIVGVAGVDLTFRLLCLGGEGGLVELEWRPFVNNLEIDAVAVEVDATGSTVGGVRREGRGRGGLREVEGDREGGDFSRMIRRDSRVRSTWRLSLLEVSPDEAESSSMGSIMAELLECLYRTGESFLVRERERI
ncbi:unnamed protein product [Somion occarium]|uniref:Uncharacterized protein n=1 Tax=Somion occarium TaxID=3059160 RepID=A0ABP1CX77_9APHY